MSYSMPSSENKENKAYSRWIFFNLRRNQIARILEHLQKGMFVPTRGASVYKQHNLSNFLQKEVPMGSDTCLKNNDERFSLTFRPKSPAKGWIWEYSGPPGASGEYFFGFARSPRAVCVLMGPTRTPNEKIKTVLVSICPFYGSPWKYFIFSCAFCLTAPNILSSIVEISFPHIYWPMPGMPFCSWLSRPWVTACHPAKTSRIRHIAAGFSSIYGQMRSPGS